MIRNKLTIIGLVIIIIVAVVALALVASSKENEEALSQVSDDSLNNVSRELDMGSEEAIVRPRAYLLEWLKTAKEADLELLASTKFDSMDRVYAAYYPPNVPYVLQDKLVQNYNHPESSTGGTRGGVIVFTNDSATHIQWESSELFGAAGSIGFVTFTDIDNDKVDELILKIAQGARLIPALWIYKWNGKEFTLINPNPESETESSRWMAGISADLNDVDGDNVLEVITTNGDGGPTSVERTYKFDGSYYSLSKEEPVSQIQ